MYKAIVNFTDLQDGKRAYSIGDVYPREGYTPTEARINELLSGTNKRGMPVIERVSEKATVSTTETVEVLPKRKKRKLKDSE